MKSLTRRIFLLCLVCGYATTLATAQIAGGLTDSTNTHLGGNNYIVGSVFSPDGQPITIRMRIRLTSPTWGDILAMTDDRGRFVFSEVASGVYTISIEGEKEYEPVSQQVSITRDRNFVPETYSVTIRLREKVEPRVAPSVISAANAGVPKPALDHYLKASKLAAAKDYDGALKELKLAVAEYPDFVNAFNQMGVLYLLRNDLKNAEEVLKKALKINPEAYDPLVNYSVALFRLERFKEAESSLRQTLRVKAESAVAYYYLGRTLNKLGQNEAAETALLTCIKLSPNEFKEAHRVLAAIYVDRGVLPRAIEELETYLKLVPNAPDAEHLKKVIEQAKHALEKSQPQHR